MIYTHRAQMIFIDKLFVIFSLPVYSNGFQSVVPLSAISNITPELVRNTLIGPDPRPMQSKILKVETGKLCFNSLFGSMKFETHWSKAYILSTPLQGFR